MIGVKFASFAVAAVLSFGIRACFPDDAGQQASAGGGVVGFRYSCFELPGPEIAARSLSHSAVAQGRL